MTNRVVSTKLTEEEHQKLVDNCGVSGQSPSAFIRDLIKRELQSRFSQTTSADEASHTNSLPAENSDNNSSSEPKVESVNTNADSFSLLAKLLDSHRKRQQAIKKQNLKHGDMLDGKVVIHCSQCGELC